MEMEKVRRAYEGDCGGFWLWVRRGKWKGNNEIIIRNCECISRQSCKAKFVMT